jgi:hypothetical protein
MKRWLSLGITAAVLALVGLGDHPHPAKGGNDPRSSAAWCGGSQAWQAARRHMGEPFRVRARVASVHYAASSSGRPTFLDLGHAYPSRNRLTVLIWGRNRSNFPRPPERMFRRGTVICAQGVLTSHRGVPEIEVALWDADGRLLSF